MDIRNVALVSGGASGLGEATTRHLHRLGAHVVVFDRDETLRAGLSPGRAWEGGEHMTGFARDEVDEAFQHYWKVGCVDEDWAAWTELFTPDVVYVDHFWGPLHGREEVDPWIHAVMKGVPEIYTVLDWYAIDGDRVVFRMENRRDNPDGEGPPYFDFPGLSVLTYAGDGLWSAEEDYWDRDGARRTTGEYVAACKRAGVTTPEERMRRGHWPDGPVWARTDAPPSPSWLARDDLPGITRPGELRALLARG